MVQLHARRQAAAPVGHREADAIIGVHQVGGRAGEIELRENGGGNRHLPGAAVHHADRLAEAHTA